MNYSITDVKCPECGEYLFDVGGLHACFECGHERSAINPMDTLMRDVNYAMMPDDDIHG